jgi:hypothetical protein
MSGFTLSYTTNMFILMIPYGFCLFPVQFCYIIIYTWKVKSCVHIAERCAPWKISSGGAEPCFPGAAILRGRCLPLIPRRDKRMLLPFWSVPYGGLVLTLKCSLFNREQFPINVLNALASIYLPSQSQSQSYLTTDGQSVSLSWCQAPIWGVRSDFLLLSRSCGFVDVGRSLWRENGSAVYNCCWSSAAQSFLGPSPAGLVTYFTVSDLRLPQPGGPGTPIYTPHEQCGPVIPPATGFPFRHLLRLAGLRWRYSNLPPRGVIYLPLCPALLM